MKDSVVSNFNFYNCLLIYAIKFAMSIDNQLTSVNTCNMDMLCRVSRYITNAHMILSDIVELSSLLTHCHSRLQISFGDNGYVTKGYRSAGDMKSKRGKRNDKMTRILKLNLLSCFEFNMNMIEYIYRLILEY